MNRTSLLISAIFGLILVLICFSLWHKDAASWHGAGFAASANVLSEFNPNNVSKMVIRTGKQQVVLAKNDDGWVVANRDGYPADYKKFSDLLLTLKDLRVAQFIEAGPSQFSRLQLLKSGNEGETGTQLEFFGSGERKMVSLIVGKEHFRQKQDNTPYALKIGAIPDGRYLMVDDGKNRPLLAAKPLTQLVADPTAWLDKNFITIDRIKSIELKNGVGKVQWKIFRNKESEDWQLAGLNVDKEEVEPAKLLSLASACGYLSFNDVNERRETAAFKPEQTISVTTLDGFTYDLALAEQDDNMRMRIMVTADLPTKRVPANNEKVEDFKRLDSEFAAELKLKKEKLAKEKFFSERIFLVAKSQFQSLLAKRDALVKLKAIQPNISGEKPSPTTTLQKSSGKS